jgi:hypothetical protein
VKKVYWRIGMIAALLGLVVGSLSLAAGAAPNGVEFKSWSDNPFTSRTSALPTSHEGGQTIILTSKETNSRGIDVEGDGEGPGDYVVFREALYNKDGVHVGRDNGQCTINFPANQTRFSQNCAVAVTFNGTGGIRKGQIMVEGNLVFSETTTTLAVPITGGSGHYQNVRGEVHVGAKLVLHLLP